jgi:ubiquinol-cytochrome c reductase cytochrome b subunit
VTVFRRVSDWLAHRFGWGPFKAAFLDRRVPKTPWYYGDGATLGFLLGVLVVTGAVMALTYSPTPDTAYRSVEHITARQTLGWFVRGLHYWSAGLMVVMLFFHLFRLILVAAYKAPREGTWLIGVALFFLVLAMSFTGYVLRWDERGVHGVRVALSMFHRVPWVGDELVLVVQGGPEMGAQTLTRLYAVHVVVIPVLLLLPLTAVHMYLIVVRGVTSPAERAVPVKTAAEQEKLYHAQAEHPAEGEPFHPYTSGKSLAMALVVFALAVGLTLTVGPRPLTPEGNLIEPSQPSEEWWFWWYSGLIALVPPGLAPYFYVGFPLLLFVFLVSLPFVDRGPYRGMRHRPAWVAGVIFCVLAILFLTDYRRRSPFTAWPDPEPPPLPAGVRVADAPGPDFQQAISPDADRGRVLFARYGCTSCHPVAGHPRTRVGPDIAELDRLHPPPTDDPVLKNATGPRSKAYIRHVILDGWRRPDGAVTMPGYRGRLSEDALERIVEFCHVAQTFPRER